MKIAIFVHEFSMEVGHSHALIETIRHLPQDIKNNISKIKVVAFESDSPDKLFPELKDIVEIKRLPLIGQKPFLLKMAIYHFITFLYSKIFLRKWLKIGIGIASIDVDITNIQFVHKQWDPLYFQHRKLNFLSLLYKKILFFYFNFFEKFLYSSKKLKVSALSKFVYDYMKEDYSIHTDNIVLAYSGVNLERFSPAKEARLDIFDDLKKKYSQLEKIDPTKIIYLFIGAFERKGLLEVFRELKKKENPQLILIGKPEASSNIEFPSEINIAHISFTKEVPLFYSLCDHFLFPTHYEPFGLVLIEAAASGMHMSTTRKFVGASELLENLNGIDIYEDPQSFKIIDYSVLSETQRNDFYHQRISALKKLSWKKTGKEFGKLFLNFSKK